AAVAAAFVAFYVTGYFDWRYFTSSFWLIELVALAYIARELPRHFDIVACLVAVSCVAVLSWPLSRSPRLIDAAYLRDVADRHDVDSLRTCLLRDGANARDLAVFSHDVERLTTYRFAALASWRATQLPTNWPSLSEHERAVFLER